MKNSKAKESCKCEWIQLRTQIRIFRNIDLGLRASQKLWLSHNYSSGYHDKSYWISSRSEIKRANIDTDLHQLIPSPCTCSGLRILASSTRSVYLKFCMNIFFISFCAFWKKWILSCLKLFLTNKFISLVRKSLYYSQIYVFIKFSYADFFMLIARLMASWKRILVKLSSKFHSNLQSKLLS